MAEEFETVELEISEDDIVYYLYDEQDQEIGFVVEEDGAEVEYYYEWVDSADYEGLEAEEPDEVSATFGESEGEALSLSLEDMAELDGEVVEMEIDEDAIDHYLVDEQGREIGFVIVEDGVEVECYYQEDDEDDEDDEDGDDDEDDEGRFSYDDFSDVIAAGEAVGSAGSAGAAGADASATGATGAAGADANANAASTAAATPASSPQPGPVPAEPTEPVEHGYLYKMAQIVGHQGNKARKAAGAKLVNARDKAAPVVSEVRAKAGEGVEKARTKAEEGVERATGALETGGGKLKEKKDEYDLGITREGVKEATADLNAIAKEGAATAKELKEAYDDIMDSFGFLVPKGVRRKLP